MTYACGEVRLSLGVYVLGAIEPAERARVEAHLARCPACRDELAVVAGLPALLGRVNEEQIVQLAGPPADLLDTLLAKVAEDRRRPLWRRVGDRVPLAVAAAVLIVVGALFGGLVTAELERPVRTVSPPPSASSRPPAEQLVAADAGSGVSAKIEVRDERIGLTAWLHLKGVPVGTRCRLEAVMPDGRRDSLGSWRVASKAYTGFVGSSMLARDEVVAFEVMEMTGTKLLRIPA